jgi:AraC family transcriptional regulator
MRPQTEQSYKERILRVLVHIQNHLDEAISLEELARVAHFSPHHFHRIFHGMVGESVKEHVRRLRLERAAHQLKFHDQAITHIAFQAGYETHEAFTRAFGAMFGASPTQFRGMHRTPPLRAAPSGVPYVPDGRLDAFEPLQPGGTPVDVHIEKVPVMRVAFMRHVGPYSEVEKAWEKMLSWAGQRGLLGPRTTYVGIGHDDPQVTPPDRLRYDACIVVADNFQPEADVGVEQVGGGEYAVTTHRGPYEKLWETYAQLCGQWLPASGRELQPGPGFEIYRTFAENTPPENLLTDIYLPLVPR